jgi:hypothetical protein
MNCDSMSKHICRTTSEKKGKRRSDTSDPSGSNRFAAISILNYLYINYCSITLLTTLDDVGDPTLMREVLIKKLPTTM